jgi:hypothetical protein
VGFDVGGRGEGGGGGEEVSGREGFELPRFGNSKYEISYDDSESRLRDLEAEDQPGTNSLEILKDFDPESYLKNFSDRYETRNSDKQFESRKEEKISTGCFGGIKLPGNKQGNFFSEMDYQTNPEKISKKDDYNFVQNGLTQYLKNIENYDTNFNNNSQNFPVPKGPANPEPRPEIPARNQSHISDLDLKMSQLASKIFSP